MPTSTLIGYWPLDVDAKDKSGRGNDGTIVKGGTDSAPAQTGKFIAGHKGMALDLANPIQQPNPTWIKVPRSDALDETGASGAFTAMAWVNPKEFDNEDDFNFAISRHEVGTPFEIFALGTLAGRPSLGVHFFFATAAAAVPIGMWTHIAGTYDGITMTVYADGVQSGSLDVGWPISADVTHAIIGGNQNIDVIKESWNGLLDEVRLYSTALSASEILADMNK